MRGRLARKHTETVQMEQAKNEGDKPQPEGGKVLAKARRASIARRQSAAALPHVDATVLDWLSKRVRSIRPYELEALTQSKKPDKVMTVVAGALCVLLNIPEPSWRVARRVLRREGFTRKLAMVHPSQLEPYAKRIARKLAQAEQGSLAQARSNAPVFEA